MKGHTLPETQVQACPRVKVSDLMQSGLAFPERFFSDLENNQKLETCCRDPESHEIEAFRSAPDEPIDTYVFHCSCGRKHRRFMVGKSMRPGWKTAG